MDKNLEPLILERGQVYVLASGKDNFVEYISENVKNKVIVINYPLSKRNPYYCNNKFYEKKFSKDLRNTTKKYSIFFDLDIGDIINFTDSNLLTLITESNDVDLIILGLSGLDWSGIEKTFKLALKFIESNINKSILLFQGNTDQFQFPAKVLEKVGHGHLSFKEWINCHGKSYSEDKFKLKI